MNMISGVNNLGEVAKAQNVKFGSNTEYTPQLESKPDEVSFSGQNTGTKILAGAAVLAAVVGFRKNIAGFFQKKFPNFAKQVGQKFTTVKEAIIGFFKKGLSQPTVAKAVNTAKETTMQTADVVKDTAVKVATTVKDATVQGIQTVSEKAKNVF